MSIEIGVRSQVRLVPAELFRDKLRATLGDLLIDGAAVRVCPESETAHELTERGFRCRVLLDPSRKATLVVGTSVSG
jgi:hypothetical protein